MMFYQQAGVVVRWCRAAECAQLAQRAAQGPVQDLGSVTGVVVAVSTRSALRGARTPAT